jgi:hypothetical protein
MIRRITKTDSVETLKRQVVALCSRKRMSDQQEKEDLNRAGIIFFPFPRFRDSRCSSSALFWQN